MATVTITASGLTARSKTISAAHTTRLLAAYKAIYGVGLTDQQVFDAFTDGIFLGMIDNVRTVEEAAAIAAAKASVTLVVMS